MILSETFYRIHPRILYMFPVVLQHNTDPTSVETRSVRVRKIWTWDEMIAEKESSIKFVAFSLLHLCEKRVLTKDRLLCVVFHWSLFCLHESNVACGKKSEVGKGKALKGSLPVLFVSLYKDSWLQLLAFFLAKVLFVTSQNETLACQQQQQHLVCEFIQKWNSFQIHFAACSCVPVGVCDFSLTFLLWKVEMFFLIESNSKKRLFCHSAGSSGCPSISCRFVGRFRFWSHLNFFIRCTKR